MKSALLPFSLLLWLLFLCECSNAADPQDELLEQQQCVNMNANGECIVAAADDADEEEDEEDPMLKLMPGPENFKAYVRADISSFYREPPGSREEKKPRYNGLAAKFNNISPDKLSMYWLGGGGPVFHGNIGPWKAHGTASFPGHKFIFTPRNQPERPICEFVMKTGTSVYYCNPYLENDPNNPAQATANVPTRSLDSLTPQDRETYEAHMFNLAFGERYKNFTGGQEWLAMYPRPPPKHKMWRADYFGQEHHVITKETHFFAIPDSPAKKLSLDQMADPADLPEYRAPGVMNMTIRAVSCAPRAFEIRNFLSEVEADHIRSVVQNQYKLSRSTTGSGEVSDTRTSKTTWIPRSTDAVINAVYRRAADALRLDEALVRRRRQGERPDVDFFGQINEDLQIVHYAETQEYTPHHDFGYSTAPGRPSRSINLCLYLNDVPRGGHTSFPRWRNAETSDGLKIKPEKTKAIIFYMINPDGNLDDLTQHAGMPVIEGEKWFSNLWFHDPKK